MSQAGTNHANTTKAAQSIGKQSMIQDSEGAGLDREKSSQRDDLSEANEARSEPNRPSGIASFIVPDSMADIFGEDWKPPPQPEIKVQAAAKIETK